ncbi:MAG: PAS domain S-box protein [bacterium]
MTRNKYELAAMVDELLNEQLEARNKLILDSVGEGIYGMDLEGNIIFINPSAVQMTGYGPTELGGHHKHEILHHTRADGSPYPYEECPIHATIKDGIPRHITDEIFWRKDGSSFPVAYVSTPIEEKGKITGAVVVFKDFTERQRTEEALRKSQKQMAEAQRLARVGSFEWDIAKDEVSWSEGLYRIFGFEEHVMGLCLEERIIQVAHPDDHDYLRGLFQTALNDKKPFEYQHRCVRGDGATCILQGRAEVFTDTTGKPVKIVGFVQDITELKQAEEALRESEKKYRLIVENAQEGIWAIDEEAKTTFVNKRMADMLGYTVDEMLGKSLFFFMDEEAVALACHYFKRREQGIRERHDFEFFRKDGSRIYTSMVASPIIDDEENFSGALGMVADVTEQKRAEEEKARIQAQLLQSQKMEAIGVLAGGVAHDFNNLLTSIIGYTSMAMLKADESNPLFGDLKQVRLAAERATNLTRQLLLFSRKQLMKAVSLDLNKTVVNLLKMLHRLIGEDILIETEFEPDLWSIRADEGTIEQVIMNLAVNARDAMPRGGQLVVKTKNVTLDENLSAAIPQARPGRFVRLSLADTGTGMDRETMSHIFEPFFTTKGLGKGTGLGLAVVYGIVEQHEGWIHVSSEPGKGSAFEIYLPVSPAMNEDKPDEKISLQKFQGRGERILVVEDEESVREVAVKTLQENGYLVAEAVNGQEALNIFDQAGGRFDLVFSDMILPDQTGLDLVDRLLWRQPGLKVLIVSGYTDQKSQWPVIRKRGFRFLQKPFDLPDLLRVLREVIEPDTVNV